MIAPTPSADAASVVAIAITSEGRKPSSVTIAARPPAYWWCGVLSMPASVPAMIRTPMSCIRLTFSPTAMPVSSATYGAFTLMVGHTTMPRSAIRTVRCSSKCRSLVSVTQEQCSIVVTPASTARRMPSRPWACAATGLSIRLASATITASCSTVNWAYQGADPFVMNPPVAMTLIRSAPCL